MDATSAGQPLTPVRHQTRNRIFLIFLVGLLLFFVASYVDLFLDHLALKAEIDTAAARLYGANERGLRLERQLQYVQTDAFKETVARDRLGMVQAGDNVFAVIVNPEETLNQAWMAPPNAPDVRDLPVWQQWLALFNLDIEILS